MQHKEELAQQIVKLKKEQGALILAHTYQDGAIQDIADYVGDSLGLARKGQQAKEEKILFCGVRFMAETVKLLSPTKTVLLPAADAYCPMAQMASVDDLLAYKKGNPETYIVSYVNSTTEVKALSDLCITSSNALKLIKNLDKKEILILPDQNLGTYIKNQLPHHHIKLWPGRCITHHRVQHNDILKVRELHKDAPILIHPECTYDVVKEGDFVGSTTQIIDYVGTSKANTFIIGTEMGVLHILKNRYPQKRFYLLSTGLVCNNMKKTRLHHVLDALKYNQHQIDIDPKLIQPASLPILKMLERS